MLIYGRYFKEYSFSIWVNVLMINSMNYVFILLSAYHELFIFVSLWIWVLYGINLPPLIYQFLGCQIRPHKQVCSRNRTILCIRCIPKDLKERVYLYIFVDFFSLSIYSIHSSISFFLFLHIFWLKRKDIRLVLIGFWTYEPL